jgi:hypothetical protein
MGRAYDFITMFAVANTVLINYVMGSGCCTAWQSGARAAHTRHDSHRAADAVRGDRRAVGVVVILAFSGTVAELGAATGCCCSCASRS